MATGRMNPNPVASGPSCLSGSPVIAMLSIKAEPGTMYIPILESAGIGTEPAVRANVIVRSSGVPQDPRKLNSTIGSEAEAAGAATAAAITGTDHAAAITTDRRDFVGVVFQAFKLFPNERSRGGEYDPRADLTSQPASKT